MRLKRLSNLFIFRPFLWLQERELVTQRFGKLQMDSTTNNLKFFFIKTCLIFVAIYLCIIIPLSRAIELGFSGFDQALSKPSSKLILIGLISNPEVLYQIANQELANGNLEKANNFILAAIGVIEIHQTGPLYKSKFYDLEKRISAARKPNAQ